MTDTQTPKRRLTAQIHWRADVEDAALVDRILTTTGETQSALLRRLVTEEARRLGLDTPP